MKEQELSDIEMRFQTIWRLHMATGAADDMKRLMGECRRLRAALQEIRDTQGKVCELYEICQHQSCRSSYESWCIAEQVLGPRISRE